MFLDDSRNAIRHLLDPNDPADARAFYYAFDHSDLKTTIITHYPEAHRAIGYVCLSITGMDLFRPLITMRLPHQQLQVSTELIYNAIPEGSSVIMSVPSHYMPLIRALFEIHSEEEYSFLTIQQKNLRPIMNVLVSTDIGPNNLPRAIIRRQDEVVASASLNWQSRYFAELNVQTQPQHRRQGWGRSVITATTLYVFENSRIPLYAVATENRASRELAQSIGFINTGHREILVEATLKPSP